jgi:hypothetical protein
VLQGSLRANAGLGWLAMFAVGREVGASRLNRLAGGAEGQGRASVANVTIIV